MLASSTFDAFVAFAKASADAATCGVADAPVDAALVVGICLAGFEATWLAKPDCGWAVAWGAGEGRVGEVLVGADGRSQSNI